MKNDGKQVLLDVKNLKKYFNVGNKKILKAVDDISLQIYKGETLGLVGESGCGKSTTGRTILRLIEKTDGQVLFNGKDVYGLSNKEMRDMRTKMQIIFQDPYSSLNPRFTIGQIIEEGLITHKFYRQGSQKMRDHVVNTMKECGLQEYMLFRYPHQFSGGQRQRISIARALLKDAPIVLLDEATASLDVENETKIQAGISELVRNKTVLIIAHRMRTVANADKIVVLENGSVAEMGTPEELKKKNGIFARMVNRQVTNMN